MKYTLRKVSEEDCDLLFNWANDADVRQNSFTTEKIGYDRHCTWFRNILLDKKILQFIYLADDVPVGQIRLNINEEKGEISYSVSKEHRGNGHGKTMLGLLADVIRREHPNIKKLTAKVKTDNEPSVKAFLKSGYKEVYREFSLDL